MAQVSRQPKAFALAMPILRLAVRWRVAPGSVSASPG